LKSFLLNVLFAYVSIALLAYFASDFMIFFPPRAGYTVSSAPIELKTADGATIYAYYLPNPKAKYTILISHGNAEDIGYMLPYLRAWHDHGFAVFAYDYHGYGLSSGRPNESRCYQDVNAAYRYLTEHLHVKPETIIAYGRSLGGAMALDLAVHQKVAAVIMESSFVTAFRVVTRIPLLPFDKFNNLQKLSKLTVPILIIHGTDDHIVPFWHGKKLAAVAHEPKLFYVVQGADHNDLYYVAGDAYWKMIDEWGQVLTTDNAAVSKIQ